MEKTVRSLGTTPALRTFVLFIPYLAVGLVHLTALAIGDDALSGFTKPLLMPVLLVALLFALPRWRTFVALVGSLALLFSWAGDVGLSSSDELAFIVALGFFLIAHVAYITLFIRKLRMRRISLWGLIYLAWWITLLVILAPHIGSLLIPVAVYGLVLGAMGGIALSCNRLIAVGGVLFVASDTILALNKFLPGFDLWQVDFFIMMTYIAAQGLIIVGVIRWAWTNHLAEPHPSQTVTSGVS